MLKFLNRQDLCYTRSKRKKSRGFFYHGGTKNVPPGRKRYNMRNVIELQRKIAPELAEIIECRYEVLRHIRYAQPVGRRALAAQLAMSERTLRAQVEFLREAGLVHFSPLGMEVSEAGAALLPDLTEYVKALRGIAVQEEELAKRLGLKRVLILPGDADCDETAKRELGRAAANFLGEFLVDEKIVAVSGGSMMAAVADQMAVKAPGVLVVPARGGLGDRLEYQANSVAAVMAQRVGGSYRQLYVPDSLSEETLAGILAEDDQVKAVVNILQRADIVVHGVGEMTKMAQRRRMKESQFKKLTDSGAVGEALGQYCALDGRVVYVTKSVGLLLHDLSGISLVIAVAGGASKAEAILAVMRAGRQHVLVTDEAAARGMLQKLDELDAG